MQEPDFWVDQPAARATTSQHDALKQELDEFLSLEKEIEEVLELAAEDKEDKQTSLRVEL